MFDHVLLNVPARAASMRFYTPVLEAIGIRVLYDQGAYTGYGVDRLQFWLHDSTSEDVTRKAHLAFPAQSRQAVDEFFRVAFASGGRSNGAPGIREHGPQYYAAYVLDPEGNNIEAVCNR